MSHPATTRASGPASPATDGIDLSKAQRKILSSLGHQIVRFAAACDRLRAKQSPLSELDPWLQPTRAWQETAITGHGVFACHLTLDGARLALHPIIATAAQCTTALASLPIAAQEQTEVLAPPASLNPDSEVEAPKRRAMPAQGNALGKEFKGFSALKGRPIKVLATCVAPSGLNAISPATQGVALGWHRSGRWPATSEFGLNDPLWPALLRLRPLRDFWERELRRDTVNNLLDLLPDAWLLDPTPLPHGSVIPRLEIASWNDLNFSSRKFIPATPAGIAACLSAHPDAPGVLTSPPEFSPLAVPFLSFYRKSETRVDWLGATQAS